MAYKLGKGSQEVYDSGLNVDMLEIIDRSIVVCPVEFTLTSGLRTYKEQFELFQIGRKHESELGILSNPEAWVETGGGVVTNCDGLRKLSNHQSGKAIDLCVYIPGRPDMMYDKYHMMVIVGSFLTISNMLYQDQRIGMKLRSGADWDRDTQFMEKGTFIDMPHLELFTP